MIEVGEYLLSEVLDYVAQGKSPVDGKPFKKLTKEYADEHKGGSTLANLDLHGDMMRAMELSVQADKIEVGIYDEAEAIKAYGHITGFKGHPWLEGKVDPRKLLPGEKETFARPILEGVQDIIDTFVEVIRDREDSEEASS